MSSNRIVERPYQREAIEAVAAAYRRGVRRAAISLPTGCGKTLIMALITDSANTKGSSVLFLVHTDELMQQTEDKLLNVAPHLKGRIGWVKAGLDDFSKPIVIASVQTLARSRRLQRIIDAGVEFDIIFQDELHHAAAESYQRIYEALGVLESDTKTLMIGVSATPQRSDDKDLGETFEEVVYHRDILWAIENEYLVPPRAIRVQLADFDPNTLHTQAGDYRRDEAAEALRNADAPYHTVQAWRTHAKDRKTIVFTPTIDAASEMAEEFRKFDVTARNISGLPLDDRRDVLRRFREGKIQVLTNAMILTEGYDEPAVDCVVIARPTKSQILYKQMIGRGLRLYADEVTGHVKEDCIVMDMAGATDRLDLISLPKLFGLGEGQQEEIDQEEIDQIIQEEGVVAAIARIQEEQRRQGRIVARQVDLFTRKSINWVMSAPGFWSLGLGKEGNLAVRVNTATNRWSVYRIYAEKTGERWDNTKQEYVDRTRSEIEVLGEELTLPIAMGVAEDYAKASGARKLLDKNAPWRQRPVSEKQLPQLLRFRVDLPPCGECLTGCPKCGYSGTSLSRGEANDILQAKYAERDLRKLAR